MLYTNIQRISDIHSPHVAQERITRDTLHKCIIHLCQNWRHARALLLQKRKRQLYLRILHKSYLYLIIHYSYSIALL